MLTIFTKLGTISSCIIQNIAWDLEAIELLLVPALLVEEDLIPPRELVQQACALSYPFLSLRAKSEKVVLES